MSLGEASAAASGLLHFLQENGSTVEPSMKIVCAELSKLTITAKHKQSNITRFFQAAGGGAVNLLLTVRRGVQVTQFSKNILCLRTMNQFSKWPTLVNF
jgi:hypothetical protein